MNEIYDLGKERRWKRWICAVIHHKDVLREKHLEGQDPTLRVFTFCVRCGRWGWGWVRKLRNVVDQLGYGKKG